MKPQISPHRVCQFGLVCWLSLGFQTANGQNSGSLLGQFEDQGDIGTVLHRGSATFDSATGAYAITASGENMWAKADSFHFVWKKVSGDVTIAADVAFPTATGNPHKKAVLMIRQSLDSDSAYVDAALHVVGLTSLQSRAEKGEATHEVGIEGEGATTLRLEKRGAYFYMFVARKGEKLHLAGGSMRLALQEPFYIGLGVCAHDKDAVETAVFSNVSIGTPSKAKMKWYSTIETISVSSTDQRVVAVFKGHVEPPSWTTDGAGLLFRRNKSLQQISTPDGKTTPAPPGLEAPKVSKGEAPSRDGQQKASLSYSEKKPADTTLSMKATGDGKSKILAKFIGGQGTMSDSPWSPDGKRLAFVSYQLVPQE